MVLVGLIVLRLKEAPSSEIEYRYVPRTFIEEAEDPTPVTEIFAKMFYEPTPWIGHDAGKLGPAGERGPDINKFFISQT